jgi:hypothetical protein
MVRKQFKPRVHVCRNEDGLLISNEQEILDRWVRHFYKLLNGRNDNECITFTTTSSNQISKGKTHDTTDAHTIQET